MRGKLRGLLARFALIWAVVFGLVVICGLMRMRPQLESAELLAGTYFMGTTISSLAWAVCLAASISIRSKSAREALTWTIISTALLIWLINIATYVVGISLASAWESFAMDEVETVIAIVIVGRIGVELGFAALVYRSLLDNLRVYAART